MSARRRILVPSSGSAVVGAVLVLLICLAAGLPLTAAARPNPPTRGGPYPEELRRVIDRDPGAFEFSRAWRARTEAAARNRRLLEAGKLAGDPERLAALTAVSGTFRVPVFLAKYSDTGADPVPAADMRQQLYDGPWASGTITEYYDEISYGAVTVTGTVFDWVTLAHDDTYYTGNAFGADPALGHVGEMIHEILDTYDATVDFGKYDNDGPDGQPNSGDDDGIVDFIGIVHPEAGAEDFAFPPASNIWSHRWALENWGAGIYTTDDAAVGGGSIRINDYTIMPALTADGGMIEIGVFCHEYGHGFGLKDLYDTDKNLTGASDGIGHWGLMGSGNWNTPESPSHMCAWSKAELGWLVPAVVPNDLLNWPLVSSTQAPAAYKLWKDGNPGSEYFLVEYRTAVGFDRDIHAPGVLIWHIDETADYNKDETRKRVDLECRDQTGADHQQDADDLDVSAGTNRGDADDPFCDGGEFAAATKPSSVAYNGVATGVAVRNIRGCGASGELILDLIVGRPEGDVNLCLRDCVADGCGEPSNCPMFWASPEIYIDNNEDGLIDPPAEGLPNKLFARVRNLGGEDAASVGVGFWFADPALGLRFPSTATLIDAVTIPLLPRGGSETAMVTWDIPVPPPSISHYCIGVAATHTFDGLSSEHAREDNNLAQINIQELYAKAGDAVPRSAGGLAREGGLTVWRPGALPAGPGEFRETALVRVCNPDPERSCDFQIRLGSPPDYRDVVVEGAWNYALRFDKITLRGGECADLEVRVDSPEAYHLDRLELPLTLVCGEEAVGGTVLTFNIDNFAPRAPRTGELIRTLPPQTDDGPGDEALRLVWRDDFVDEAGFPERVERWRVYVAPEELPDPAVGGLLVAETAIDADPRTPEYEHLLPVRPDEEKLLYALVAVDRAGNASQPTWLRVRSQLSAADDTPPAGRTILAQNQPNPFNPTTRIDFVLAEAGPVSLRIYDSRGRMVRDLVSGARPAGRNSAVWDGRDDAGRGLGSGVYLYRLEAGVEVLTNRMLLLK